MSSQTTLSGLAGSGKFTELRQRLLFVVGALIVYRIGTFISLPGIDLNVMQALFDQSRGSILEMFNMFSGGALSRMSIFALGVMPYISASIIVQLLTVVVPKFEQLKKEGDAGKRKITQYTRYGTLVLALFQAIGVAIALHYLADTLATYQDQLTQHKWAQTTQTVRRLLEGWFEERYTIVSPALLLDGDDLQRMFGLRPGKQIGHLLRILKEAQASGEVVTQEAAIAFIKARL